ncbi:MAG TPA: hypothetical protein VES60_17365 [Nakamurella sp.]|nr:hypothetical protein [Nakamurella sp.]
MTVLIVLLTVVVLVLCVLVAGLLRAYATVLARLHQLDGSPDHAADHGAGTGTVTKVSAPPFRTADGVMPLDRGDTGRSAPRQTAAGRAEWVAAHDIVGQGLSGEVVSVRTVAVAHDSVIVFLSSGCSGCTTFWEQLADRRGLAAVGDSRVVVVTKSPEDESPSVLRQLCPPDVDLVMSSSAWADYDVPGSPYVIVVDGGTGRVKGEGSGTSLTQISGLMQQAYGDGASFGGRRRVVKPRADAEREVDVDRALLAAGIGPGHASLYAPSTSAEAPVLDPAVSAATQPAHRRLDLLDAREGNGR